MCQMNSSGGVNVEAPNIKTKEYYGPLDVQVPSMVKVNKFRKDVLHL